MVKGQRARLEVMGSNPSQRIFCVILETLGTGYFTRYQRLERAFGTAFGVPVQETGTKGHLQPVPMALFLVVKHNDFGDMEPTRDSRLERLHRNSYTT